MQEVFEKIIEELEIERTTANNTFVKYEMNVDLGRVFGLEKAIEIVKQTVDECKHGHFGCNSNGQHEKCSKCCDYDCKHRNREWFGVKDDNDGWVPCSNQFPKDSGYYLVTYHEWSIGKYLPKYDDTYVRRMHFQNGENFIGWNHPKCVDEKAESDTNREVIAWQPLPDPYDPHICTNNDCVFNEEKDCPAAEGCAGYERNETNAGRIRSMSDDELVEYLYSIQSAECELRFCKNKAQCDSKLDKGQTITDSECKKCLVEWLQSEVEE